MIGQRIKRLRKAHGESQEELGKALGRDRSVVSKWENGQVDVDLELAGKVAKHYGVSLVDVLDLESEATGKPAPTGMSEDLLPFEPNQGDPLAGIKLSANQYRFTVATDVLSNIGIHSGDVVVVDNLGSHKSPEIRAMIRAVGARLFFLPPYSPDLNPIEQIFAKLKSLLRKAAARTVAALWNAIADLIPTVTPNEALNCFRNSGYVWSA